MAKPKSNPTPSNAFDLEAMISERMQVTAEEIKRLVLAERLMQVIEDITPATTVRAFIDSVAAQHEELANYLYQQPISEIADTISAAKSLRETIESLRDQNQKLNAEVDRLSEELLRKDARPPSRLPRKERSEGTTRIRRSKDDIDALKTQVLGVLSGTPQSISEIAAVVGVDTLQIKKALSDLVSEKKAVQEGKARATRYSRSVSPLAPPA